MATDILFSDIDLNFTKHPLSRDVSIKTNVQAINQAMKILLLTMYYERPFHSDIGSPIRQLLFEPVTPMLQVLLKRQIEQVLQTYEPRITIHSINVYLNPDNNSIEITIYYIVLNTSALQSFDIILERTR
jgi:phage baseplate assembly protein W